jgi:hypothetical protein
MFALGVAVPCLITWFAFLLQGGGYEFVQKNFLLNAGWKVRLSPLPVLSLFFVESWPVILLACGGCFLLRPSRADWCQCIICATLTGLLAGLWAIPVAREQYFLMLIPLLALVGARYLLHLSEEIPSGVRQIVLSVALVALAVLPALDLKAEFKRTNREQLRQLRFVMEHSTPSETVMDGWRGLGVFRPHAFYYYFLHPEIRAMLPAKDLDAFLSDLEAGRNKPKIIVLDDNLRQLSDRFTDYMKQHYVLSNEPGIYVRKPDE